jgi:hypothetical protein
MTPLTQLESRCAFVNGESCASMDARIGPDLQFATAEVTRSSADGSPATAAADG